MLSPSKISILILLGFTTTGMTNSSEETWVLQKWITPQGITLQLEAPPGSPILLRAYNFSMQKIWEKKPGDEANTRIQWNPEGTILAITTNSQETDRDFWTKLPESQNHLILLDPRDGKILEQHDLDTILQLDPNLQEPRETTMIWEKTQILLSWKHKRGEIKLTPQTLQEIQTPKKIGEPNSFNWETP